MIIPEKLYQEICHVMPIPCVDLLVMDEADKILLLLRRNEPSVGQWWLPGGRVHFGETRAGAVVRKLKEECGLKANSTQELGTFDVLIELQESQGLSHGITTVFKIKVVNQSATTLDGQSSAAAWRPKQEWLSHELHPFVQQCLRLA